MRLGGPQAAPPQTPPALILGCVDDSETIGAGASCVYVGEKVGTEVD